MERNIEPRIQCFPFIAKGSRVFTPTNTPRITCDQFTFVSNIDICQSHAYWTISEKSLMVVGKISVNKNIYQAEVCSVYVSYYMYEKRKEWFNV